MDVLDSRVNRRAFEGNLPSEKLYPVYESGVYEIDFGKEAAAGKEILKHNPEMLFYLLGEFRKSIQEIDMLFRPELYNNDINCYINTLCHEDCLTVESYIDACNLTPVVTAFDKMIWYGAFSYHMDSQLLSDITRQYDPDSMTLAWVDLFNTVQKKEIQSEKTIRFDVISISDNLLDIILSDWETINQKYFVNLTSAEINKLKRIVEKRDSLAARIASEKKNGKIIAEKTNEEWGKYIDFLNDLSEREAEVIVQINKEDASAKDKLRSISSYNSVLYRLSKGHYDLDGNEIQMLGLFDAVHERITKAPSYSKVCDEDGSSFALGPMPFALSMDPKTYNYLYILFHQFRMAPSKESAKQFVELALKCIKNNLGEQGRNWVSLNDMISDFHSTVLNFADTNKDAIERLSFEKLQRNMVAVGDALYYFSDSEYISQSMSEELRSVIESDEYEKKVEDFISGKRRVLGQKEVQQQAKKVEDNINTAEELAVAKRIIVSLNIIYLFCDALRIMLTNKRAHVKLNKEKTERIRRDLLKLDDTLVHKIYAHLGETEIGMLEYREKAGIISSILSEQENQEEVLRNAAFSEILKDSIIRLTDCIEDHNTEGIIEIKSDIKNEIMRFPGCDEKEQYSEWIDSISVKICNALINNCKLEQNDYDAIKQGIQQSIGDKSHELPKSTIDSLTTAEMLYARYATDEFAEKGFDFSCISALYYQAFEDAYNGLIWKSYADELNKKMINGKSYIDIILGKKPIDPDAIGYLHESVKQRNYYIQFRSREKGIKNTTVSSRCMYKPFAKLMEEVKPSGELDKFCDYFAEITGFKDRTEMFRNSDFMNLCFRFTKTVKDSADNRNNASHGGTFISKNQCTEDKKTVLNDLEVVRSSSIGLIQQLLYLLFKE